MNNDLLRLASFIPKLESGNFDVGSWGETDGEGVMTMPYFSHGKDLSAFRTACYPLMIQGFDWAAWIHTEDAMRVKDDLESASLDELRQFITAIIRQERFVDGLLASAYESGDFLRIARRADVLSQAS